MRKHTVEFDGHDTELALGWLMRVRAPKIASGCWKLRITAVTPIHCRCGTVHYTAPTANNIKGTLESFTARRLGLKAAKNDILVRLLYSSAFPDRLRLAGNGGKLGEIAGWSGGVDVETNAFGRLLLECAALGIGLGGKTAFGFGRIKVEEIT
jgi:hypothetical protein